MTSEIGIAFSLMKVATMTSLSILTLQFWIFTSLLNHWRKDNIMKTSASYSESPLVLFTVTENANEVPKSIRLSVKAGMGNRWTELKECRKWEIGVGMQGKGMRMWGIGVRMQGIRVGMRG